jgi:hypothetical protein
LILPFSGIVSRTDLKFLLFKLILSAEVLMCNEIEVNKPVFQGTKKMMLTDCSNNRLSGKQFPVWQKFCGNIVLFRK